MTGKAILFAIGLLAMILGGPRSQAQTNSDDLKAWGLATLDQIETDFALPGRNLYADQWKSGQVQPGGPAFMWGCGVQLSALAAAARLEPARYKERLRRYVSGLEAYWTAGDNGIYGYDVLPGPKRPDRYYDDNVWMALAMAEVYEVTQEATYRDRAEAIFAFVLSGEDDKLGGGIYWHEQAKKSKHACSNGSAAAAALRLYQITGKREYLDTGKRLHDWMNAHLQDEDGLYWDHIRLDGTIEKTKWSYNTALMLRSDCLLYAITQEKTYLAEAERVAKAAEARWIRPDTGAIADGAAFAHLLSEAFLYLYEQDADRHWLEVSRRALKFVHEKEKDADGHYGNHWDQPVTNPLDKVSLLSQASAARAFLMAAHLTRAAR